MLPDRLKELRKSKNISQAELSRKLGVTRSSINAWEMGISCPTTQYIVELSNFFDVSTDYILEINNDLMINLSNYSSEEQKIIFDLLDYFKKKR